MREIKFRGQTGTTEGKKWVYGNYYKVKSFFNDKECHFIEMIRNNHLNDFNVDENTLGQFTGLKDKNGKEIYEGDIVKAYFKRGAWKYNDKNYWGYKSGKVQYCVDGFILYIENYKEKIYPLSSFRNNDGNINELEVIGNIYDNPELLKEE